jgi:uroporphyrinogen-III decarboxylase
MTRYERLMNSIKGVPVDRPPVSFYEINGTEDINNPDLFNIYNDPSWKPLIELARDCTDRIVQLSIPFKEASCDELPPEIVKKETVQDAESIYTTTTISSGRHKLVAKNRTDKDINTLWKIEHLLKSKEDLEAYLSLPLPVESVTPDISEFIAKEKLLGDTGIAMICAGDPLGFAALLFNMEDYTIIALTEKELFHRLLQRFSDIILPQIRAIANALPDRLWRIAGPEFASPPYLPPDLFREYVTEYDIQIVDIIKKSGGYPRIHSHGNLKKILDHIAATHCTGLDPIEPQPQGDVALAYVREKYGKQMTLFGNLEAADIENLPPEKFKEKILTALKEGTAGEGRGFVLMPSACPYGRKLSTQSMKNYEKIIEVVNRY